MVGGGWRQRSLLLLDEERAGGGAVGLGYLGTVRRDGGPRIHPISPALLDGRLYAFVLRGTPKCADLHRDPRYALHSWPKPFEERFDDQEFLLYGRARPVTDGGRSERVPVLVGDRPGTGDVFDLERAFHKGPPGGRLTHVVWHAGDAASAT